MELELEIEPASSYIRGPAKLRIPEPIYEHDKMIGWKWIEVRTVDFLKGIPGYDPFVAAKDYYFDCAEWDRIISFIVNECCFPEGELTGLPYIPERWQSVIYANLFCWKHEVTDLRRYRECFIYVPRKNSKMLDLDTPIPTPTGWTTMGDIQEGQVVFDVEGAQCVVTDVHPVDDRPDSFIVTFSNGETVKACADHLWYVHSRKQHPKYCSKQQKVSRKNGIKTVANLVGADLYEDVWSTQEMLDAGVDCSYGKTFKVPLHDGIDTAPTDLPIDPYLLGYWLGDGTSTSGHITIGDQDINSVGIEFASTARRRTAWSCNVKGLNKQLRLNKLLGNKHIPEPYLRASKSQRLSLLQGLMDSDGTVCSAGKVLSFAQKNELVVEGLSELLSSLGIKYSVIRRQACDQNGTWGTYSTVQFCAFKDTHPCFRLKRKLDRQRVTPAKQNRSRSAQIVSIVPCPSVPMRCITVSSETGTYLFGKTMLPTHNTSSFGAIISLIMFFVDKEKRSQNYCCAADVEQASNNFRHCQYMIENNPKLLSRLREKRVFRSTRSFEHTDGAIYKVLSSIADTKHGLSPNFVYVDEVHAHPNSELIDVMLTGTAARTQPLVLYTTTADYDRPSVCNSLYDKAKAIASDKQWEPTFLPVIYEAQINDDFRSEKVWQKANPNYGKSIRKDYFERLVRNAQDNPVELNRFLRLHLNVRTKTETAWIPSHIWSYGNADPELPLLSVVAIKQWMSEHPTWHNICLNQKFLTATSVDVYIGRYQLYWSWFIKQIEFLKDEECYAGFDNASVKDIASFNMWFPRYGVMLHWGWCPAASIYQRSQEQNLPYSQWWEAGVINATSPLDTVDENAILTALIGDDGNKGILAHFTGCREVCFDRWGSHHVYTSLKQYGYPARAYPQSFLGMNEPCRRMEALVMDHQFFHGGHPVLDWMIGNVVIMQSRDGQIRPDRSKSTNKIDGIVAGLMAMGSSFYPEVETISDIRGLKK